MPDLTEQPSPSSSESPGRHGRHRRRRGTTRRRRQRKILLAIAATAVLGVAVWIGLAAFRKTKVDTPAVVSTQQYEFLKQAIDEGPREAEVPVKPELRPVFRFSVVPSGVYSVDEVKRALADPIVAAHYAKVDAARLKTEVLKSDHYAYVSYRKNDKIFWTKNKVLLRAGETILTDGTTRIRARCGNCISEQPVEPTAADEPDLVEFDRLVDSTPVSAPKTAHTPTVVAPLAAAPPTPVPVPTSTGTDGSKAAGMPVPVTGGFGGFGSGGGSSVPFVAGTRAGNRQPDGDTPAAGSDVPQVELPLPDLPAPPGGNGPPTLNGLLPPPEGSDGHKWSESPEGPNGPNEPTGFTTTETQQTPPSDNELNPTPVPEPGTLMLFGGGVAVLLRRVRARSR